MAQHSLARADRARQLVESGAVTIHGSFAVVRSESNPMLSYICTPDACACRDWQRRGGECKHMLAARYFCVTVRAERAARRRFAAEHFTVYAN